MRILALVGLLGCLVGCGTSGDPGRWAQRMGGTLHDARAQRAEAALAVLAPPSGEDVRVRVLDVAAVGAYAWPDGEIFVTRGLVDLLPQRELVAAIAHEAGHLLDGRHLRGPVSLHGYSSDSDAEVRADAAGVWLLRRRGFDDRVMSSMLQRVCASAAVSATCRPGLRRRIGALASR